MPFWLFNYPTITINIIDMVMRKKVIVRITDFNLRFKKPNFKKVIGM